MTVDETEMVYECRACGRTKDTKKKLVQHINSKTDSKHRGRSTDDLVMRVYPGVLPSDPSKNNYERIVEAFKRIKSGNVDGLGPDIRNDEIDKVAELSGEPKDKVVRVLEEEDIDYSWRGRPPTIHFGDLVDSRKTVLAWRYRNDGLSYKELAEKADVQPTTVDGTLSDKKWMLEPRFLEDDVEEYLEDNIDTEEILESAKEQGVIEPEDNGTAEEMAEVVEEMVDEGNRQEEEDVVEEVREKVLDDNSDEPLLTLDDPDDVFDYIHSLVVSGKRDKAREIFKELVKTEKN